MKDEVGRMKEKGTELDAVVAVYRRVKGAADKRELEADPNCENAPSPAPGGRGLPLQAEAAQGAGAAPHDGDGDRPPLPRMDERDVVRDGENAPSPAPGGRGLPPAADATKKKRRSHREALLEYWREVKAGRRTRVEKPYVIPKAPDRNPIFDLPDADRLKLYVLLRECPLMEVVQAVLEERGVPAVTVKQVDEFFAVEAEHYWQVRTSRAVSEADALIRLGENSVPKLSAGMLNALAQEAFRLITSSEPDPSAMNRIATLFMRARSDDRVDQMQRLKLRKIEAELQDRLQQAFNKLNEEVECHPAAREALKTLSRELAEHAEGDK